MVREDEADRDPDGAVRVPVEVADTFWTRLLGLLGRGGLPEGRALYIRPCSSIHTWFMRFPIDVCFVDAGRRVLRIDEAVGPWRMRRCSGADAVLEFAAGEARRQGLSPGCVVDLVEV